MSDIQKVKVSFDDETVVVLEMGELMPVYTDEECDSTTEKQISDIEVIETK